MNTGPLRRVPFCDDGTRVITMDSSLSTNRRTAARLVGAASLTALSGCTGLRLTNPASGASDDTTFRLGAEASGWAGLAPEQIVNERNPVLRLPSSATVELTWKNVDGKRHRLVVEDSGGRTLVESAASSTKGETRTVTFEARREMTTYLDPAYPVQMRGEILVTEG